MNVSIDNVLIIASAAAAFVKVIVDVCRLAWPTAPAWVFPVLALVFSPPCVVAVMALGDPIVWTQQTVAGIFLGSIACVSVAVASSSIQKKADDARREVA